MSGYSLNIGPSPADLDEESVKWAGVLFYIDEPSLKAPSGARGHRVKILRSAAENMVAMLPGSWLGRGHSSFRDFEQIGVVEEALIMGTAVLVSGTMRPTASLNLAAGSERMGLSFEADHCHCLDVRRSVWEISSIGSFNGIALLPNPSFRSGLWWL